MLKTYIVSIFIIYMAYKMVQNKRFLIYKTITMRKRDIIFLIIYSETTNFTNHKTKYK